MNNDDFDPIDNGLKNDKNKTEFDPLSGVYTYSANSYQISSDMNSNEGQSDNSYGDANYGQPGNSHGNGNFEQPGNSSRDGNRDLAIGSMICGILGVVLFCTRAGSVFSIAAIVMGVISNGKGEKQYSKAGIILGIVGFVIKILSIIFAAIGVVIFTNMLQSAS